LHHIVFGKIILSIWDHVNKIILVMFSMYHWARKCLSITVYMIQMHELKSFSRISWATFGMLTMKYEVKSFVTIRTMLRNIFVTSSTFLEITIAQEYLLIIICMLQTDKNNLVQCLSLLFGILNHNLFGKSFLSIRIMVLKYSY